MPFVKFTGSSTTAAAATDSSETWITREGEYVVGTFSGFQFALNSNVSYIVEGTVVGGAGAGVASTSTIGPGVDNAVYIRGTGSVFGGQTGIALVADGHFIQNDGDVTGESKSGITITGDQGTITNSGAILGRTESGIRVEGIGTDIFNGGTVHGTGDAGIWVEGFGASIVNGGIARAVGGSGIQVDGNLFEIINTGVAQGGSTGVKLLGSDAQSGRLQNDGTILGNLGIQILLGSGAQTSIVNTGSITGTGGTAISAGSSDEVILNNGTIEGDVFLGFGDDIFDAGTGSLSGTLDGASGDDTLVLSDKAGPLAAFDGGENLIFQAGDSDTLDLSGFDTAIWVDFRYFGVDAWTRDDADLQSRTHGARSSI